MPLDAARWLSRHLARLLGVAQKIPYFTLRESNSHFDSGLSLQSRNCPALTSFPHLNAREGADGQAVVCPLLRGSSPTRGGAPKQHRTRRLLTNRPCSSLVYEESDSKERLRVSNWIVQRLYNYAVKKTVEL